MMKLTALALLGLVAAANAGAVELDGDNFDAKTADGTWFVKFLAPW